MHVISMAKKTIKRDAQTGRILKSGDKKARAKDGVRTAYELGSETSKQRAKTGGSRMVVGRNASTGQFVLAPAVKASNAFRSHKAKVVREVIKERSSK